MSRFGGGRFATRPDLDSAIGGGSLRRPSVRLDRSAKLSLSDRRRSLGYYPGSTSIQLIGFPQFQLAIVPHLSRPVWTHKMSQSDRLISVVALWFYSVRPRFLGAR